MVPEAFAIVMAPTDTSRCETALLFSLLTILEKCKNCLVKLSLEQLIMWSLTSFSIVLYHPPTVCLALLTNVDTLFRSNYYSSMHSLSFLLCTVFCFSNVALLPIAFQNNFSFSFLPSLLGSAINEKMGW